MKNFTLMMTAFVMALSACSNNGKNYTVKGELPDSSFHGKTIYLYRNADDMCIDSTVVDGKMLRFHGTAPDTAYICWVGIPHELYADFVLERGDIDADFVRHNASGTYLNDELTCVNAIIDSMSMEVEEARRAFEGRMAEFVVHYYSNLCPLMTKTVEELFMQHADDVVGERVINCFAVINKERQLELLESCGPWLGSTKTVSRKKKMLKAQIPTDNGKMYTDVKGTDLEGNPLSLSDYVGKGDFVLADFWGSWCKPCRTDMPYLKELYNKYNDKGLVVLGVCIWDEDVNNIKNAIAEEQIVWPQLVDSEDNIWKAYGIHRVPHTIFFAPDGTILMRELRKEMMVDYVSGYLDGEFEL